MSRGSADNAQVKDWHSSKHLRKRARHLLDHPEEKIPSDVAFLVGDGKNEQQKLFKCHKFILAMVSSMLQTMFYGSCHCRNKRSRRASGTDGPIKIPDVTPKAFQYMLCYAYGGNIDDINMGCMTDVLDALYCAKKYRIAKLARHCRDKIQLRIAATERDPCEVFQRALQMNEDDLATLALSQIALPSSTVMQGDAFLRLSFDCLKKIVDCAHLTAKETEVYQGVRRWVEHNEAGKTLGDAFGLLLYSIRFPLFSAAELVDGPVADGALTDAQAIRLVQSLLGKTRPAVPFLSTPRSPLAEPVEYSLCLKTTPASARPEGLISNELCLYTRPDLAPECCAFLRHLVERSVRIRISSYAKQCSRKIAPFPVALADERNVLSHSVKSACWFEWDVQGGVVRSIRIGVKKKPAVYHSAVFGFFFGLYSANPGIWEPFDLWDDRCIQGVTALELTYLFCVNFCNSVLFATARVRRTRNRWIAAVAQNTQAK